MPYPVTQVVPAAALGHYLTPTPTGFSLHMSASPRNLRAVRGLTRATLLNAGVAPDLVDSAQLVLSELYGNAVHACGDYVPLVAEVEPAAAGVWVRLHDPDRRGLPRRRGVRPDDSTAESGRGLPLMDPLAPGWDVTPTPVGKQIRCLVRH
ncbi:MULTISPECIES: ATP-binding protein [unclassified Streptomyces]|uniref:ATP-binding protein n=1 Tax=unclassified Streptomyces TaxID=2593676 RepID=UPI000DAB9F0F|nr:MULTISPECIES: ATP-binding protein [unclassified Streptomyces]PZT74367.1 ATP-binding protein [Streptomyces sp. AC1-42T]PZT82643.1 ATP-binding protein [Streptomyces sp. AC1-42W]